MENAERGLKDVLALEKKRPLLFEEDRKALVCSDDRCVRLDLGEVRIVRGVECDVRTQRKLCRDSNIGTYWIVNEPVGICIRRRKHSRSAATLAQCDARHDLECPFVFDLLEPGYFPVLDQKA